ncbi:MAG: NAD(P)/FAD-dependent oxidoreductase [Pseudomonadota bacterium]
MQTETLIVGAGLSGLALADHLKQGGRDFLLVEAQARPGGRILTHTHDGGHFDLGPAWFWPGQPRMAALTQRFGLTVFDQHSNGDLIFQDRSGAIQRGRGFASMEGSLRIDGGMGALVSALADQIPPERLLMQTRLKRVERTDVGITATLESDEGLIEVDAKRVVLAMPPRVIAETVLFDPPLDASEISAMAAIPTWMAGQTKVVAIYDQPHWREAGLSGDAMSQRGPMVEIHDASPAKGGPYALFGFVGVPADVRRKQRGDLLHAAQQQLEMMFGSKMATPREVILQDWATIPEITTEADLAPVHAHPAYGLPPSLSQIWDRRVILGSTETAPGFGGYLEGALEAAERVAVALP